MTGHVVLSCDPGRTCGLFLLGAGAPLAFQCNAAGAWSLAGWLIEASEGPATVHLAGEAFAAGTGAGARGAEADATRRVIAELEPLGSWTWRRAIDYKPWATDEVLRRAGTLEACRDMRHAADAARVGVYHGVHALGWPSPLSRKPEAARFWKELMAR